MSIPQGIFGLLGPNGAGKSTLMRTLATLQEADSGSARLDGIDMLRQKDDVRKLLGYLPQEFGLYPKVTAENLLSHFAALKGIENAKERRDVVQALLRQTNLWEHRNKPLGSFSGGMKQRFGIAQALLGNPRLIIVDGPTAGLDPEERVRFHNLLSAIAEDIVVILSTHIVSDVSDLCRNMAIIHRGRVQAAGDPSALVEALNGHVWKKAIARSEVADYQQRFRVISMRLFAGRTLLHVLQDHLPDPDFEPVIPTSKTCTSPPFAASLTARATDAMLLNIFLFELQQRLRRVSTWVYCAVFFGLGCLFILMSGGAFAGATVDFGTGGKVLVNSPYALNSVITYISFFGLVITAAIAGEATYQDIDSNCADFFYTAPITKLDYLGGRFLAAFLLQVFIFSSVRLGAWLGTVMPWLDKTRLGPQIVGAYFQPYFVNVLPNLLFLTAIFFALAALSRKMLPVYVASVLVLIGYFTVGQLSNTALTASVRAASRSPGWSGD